MGVDGCLFESGEPKRVAFVVPGRPVPSPRAQPTALMKNGKPVLGAGGRPIIVFSTQPEARDFKSKVAIAALGAARAAGWTTPAGDKRPLRVCIVFFRDARRGDLDNFAKSVMDGITQSGAVWRDDRYVVQADLEMRVDRERPRTVVIVSEMPGWIDELKMTGDDLEGFRA